MYYDEASKDPKISLEELSEHEAFDIAIIWALCESDDNMLTETR